MRAAKPNQIPPILNPPLLKQAEKAPRAPTLDAIIGYKVLKGFTLVVLAFAFYVIPEADLKAQVSQVLSQAQMGWKNSGDVGGWLELITAENMRWLTIGSVLYGLFSWLEGVGLFLRASWAAWVTIGESALFVPVEMWQLGRSFSISVMVILLLNVGVVWYLYHNRHRLFHSRGH